MRSMRASVDRALFASAAEANARVVRFPVSIFVNADLSVSREGTILSPEVTAWRCQPGSRCRVGDDRDAESDRDLATGWNEPTSDPACAASVMSGVRRHGASSEGAGESLPAGRKRLVPEQAHADACLAWTCRATTATARSALRPVGGRVVGRIDDRPRASPADALHRHLVSHQPKDGHRARWLIPSVALERADCAFAATLLVGVV